MGKRLTERQSEEIYQGIKAAIANGNYDEVQLVARRYLNGETEADQLSMLQSVINHSQGKTWPLPLGAVLGPLLVVGNSSGVPKFILDSGQAIIDGDARKLRVNLLGSAPRSRPILVAANQSNEQSSPAMAFPVRNKL